ncbi:serpin family protein [Amycolatopsis sp. cg5]|uniref:serpin family protein n=1 Tax=Amycolatopsis sp. cg5 TaxID=3238802 RepID=UPI00352366A5
MASSDEHLRFCWTLHRALAPSGGNACFSPFSIASALGLLRQSVRGRAADELDTVTAGSEPGLLHQATDLRDAEIAVSNTLWAWDRLPLNEDFSLDDWPGGRVASAPFVSDPEGAREVINADVAKTTRDLIPELLQAGTIAPDTVAALVNALYLKTAWQKPFVDRNTALAPFHVHDETREVPTLWQEETLGHGARDGWQIVTLPAGGGVEAVVLLPDGDLGEAECELDGTRLGRLLSATEDKMVRLSLPKFAIDVRSPLTATLKELGVRTIFSPSADFTPLSPSKELHVAEVLHQSVLRIDEQGLEGAAATAATMRLTAMITDDPVEVVVDRPFLLLVRHAGTGVVYFFTRVVEP